MSAQASSAAYLSAVAAGYAEWIAPMSDARGSAEYRRRVIAAEVRRAVEEVSWTRA